MMSGISHHADACPPHA